MEKAYKLDKNFDKEFLESKKKELGEAFYSLLYRAYNNMSASEYEIFDEKNPISLDEFTKILNDYLNGDEVLDFKGLLDKIVKSLTDREEPIESEIQRLEQDIIKNNQDINELSEKIKRETEFYSTEAINAQKKLYEARENLAAYKNRINDPRVREEKVREFDTLFEDLYKKNANFDTTKASILKDKNSEIESISKEYDAKLEDAKIKCRTYRDEILPYNKELLDLEKKIKELEAEQLNYEKGKYYNDHLETLEHIKDAKEDVEMYSKELEKYEVSNNRLYEDNLAYKALADEIETYTYQNFESKLKEKNTSLRQSLYLNTLEYKNLVSNIKNLNKQITSLEGKYKPYSDALAQYEAESKENTKDHEKILKNYKKYKDQENKYNEYKKEIDKLKLDLNLASESKAHLDRSDKPVLEEIDRNTKYIASFKADKARRADYFKKLSIEPKCDKIRKDFETMIKVFDSILPTKNLIRADQVIYHVEKFACVVDNKLVIKDEYNFTINGVNLVQNLLDRFMTSSYIKPDLNELVKNNYDYFTSVSYCTSLIESAKEGLEFIDKTLADINKFKDKDPYTLYKNSKLSDYYKNLSQIESNNRAMEPIKEKLKVAQRDFNMNEHAKHVHETDLENIKKDIKTSKERKAYLASEIAKYATTHKAEISKYMSLKKNCDLIQNEKDTKIKEVIEKYENSLTTLEENKEKFVKDNDYTNLLNTKLKDTDKDKTEYMLNREEKELEYEVKYQEEIYALEEEVKEKDRAKEEYFKKGGIKEQQTISLANLTIKLANNVTEHTKNRVNLDLLKLERESFVNKFKSYISKEAKTNEVYKDSKVADLIYKYTNDTHNELADRLKSELGEKYARSQMIKKANEQISSCAQSFKLLSDDATLNEACNMYELASYVSVEKDKYFNQKKDEFSMDSILSRSYKFKKNDVVSYFDDINHSPVIRERNNNHLLFRGSPEYRDFEDKLDEVTIAGGHIEYLLGQLRDKAKIYLEKKFSTLKGEPGKNTKSRMEFALNTIARVDAYMRIKSPEIQARLDQELHYEQMYRDLGLIKDEPKKENVVDKAINKKN